jgi:hypothetical protein
VPPPPSFSVFHNLRLGLHLKLCCRWVKQLSIYVRVTPYFGKVDELWVLYLKYDVIKVLIFVFMYMSFRYISQ